MSEMSNSASTGRNTIGLIAAAAGPVALAAAAASGGVEAIAMLAIMGVILYIVIHAVATPVDMPTTLDRVLAHVGTAGATAAPGLARTAEGPATLAEAMGTPLTDDEVAGLGVGGSARS